MAARPSVETRRPPFHPLPPPPRPPASSSSARRHYRSHGPAQRGARVDFTRERGLQELEDMAFHTARQRRRLLTCEDVQGTRAQDLRVAGAACPQTRGDRRATKRGVI